MSGGELVVLDRSGRDVKRYSLPNGLATLGSDPACDICVMLASISSHHATVVVRANQTIVRNVGDGDTLVNGANISIAALQHGDVITLGGRSLRWEYTNPTASRNKQIQPVLVPSAGADVSVGRGRRRRAGRRGSAHARATGADRALQLAIEMSHRASMPASSGGKQVAVVQPQRRDNNDEHSSGEHLQMQAQSSQRSRNSNVETSLTDEERSKRKSVGKANSKNATLQGTTKATLWIESRKTSPRKKSAKRSPARANSAPRAAPSGSAAGDRRTRSRSTPLRLAVLRRAQSAQTFRVTKIEEPVQIDETKQAAIMLMTGHTAKSKLVTGKPRTPSYVLKKPSPVRRTPRPRRANGTATSIGPTPRRPSSYALPRGTPPGNIKRPSRNQSTAASDISDTDTQNRTVHRSNTPRRSPQKSPQKSPLLLNPKKSALKDPKKLNRKTESIKFDLSNLENNSQETSEVVTTSAARDCAMSDELNLRYSDSSTSPSPRQSIHSRSSRILEKSIGVPMSLSLRHTVRVDSPSTRKSLRGSLIVQKALDMSADDTTFRESSDSTSLRASIPPAFKTHTLSPRQNTNMESYSIVDLVSIDSNESKSASVYNSVISEDNPSFATPRNSIGRKTRSSLDPTLLSSSTPYVDKPARPSDYSQNVTRHSRSHSNSNSNSQQTDQTITDLTSTRRSKSLSTPENTQKPISVNSTRISRPSRSRSRLNDSDLLLIDGDENDASPKSSKRISRTFKSIQYESTAQGGSFNYTNVGDAGSTCRGTATPESKPSPQNVGTPVIRIQSLLDSSQNSLKSQESSRRGGGRSSKRKSIGVITAPKKSSSGFRSKSLNTSTRRTKLNLTKDLPASNISDEGAALLNNEVVTPKSALKLMPEAVKNKHSTAKKPQSKRSLIDDMYQSDIVKQLFNSPVKRKLSQSMTEFSRKRLFDDDDVARAVRPTRNTIALVPVTGDSSVLDHTEAITPELFVSPMNTPRHSPDMAAIERLLASTSPENNLTEVRVCTPRSRRSVNNYSTNLSGVKLLFSKSPESRLSCDSGKNMFAKSPRKDTRSVSGVKTLFRRQKKSKEPKNDLSDVRGVKELFTNRSKNDLRNVYGVKRILHNVSPRNDLTDVRGVRSLFRQEKQSSECDVSGLEELFTESPRDADGLFDRLIGKRQIKSVYSKTFSSRSSEKQRNRTSKTLHSSIDEITNNVEVWLENELQRRANPSANNSLRRELLKLATDTVAGSSPLRGSRVRNSTLAKCTEMEGRRSAAAPMLPIKKRRLAHSTPVKSSLTMSASDLSRVSPIRPGSAPGTPRAPLRHQTAHGLTVHLKEASRHQAKVKTVKEKAVMSNSEIKVSPRKTRAKTKITRNSPVVGTGGTQTANKKRTLSINKKIPGRTAPASRKTKTAAKNNTIDIDEDKRVTLNKRSPRQKRGQAEVVESVPKKNIKTKIQKASIVVSKPSPVMKPRASKKVAIKDSNVPKGLVTLQENNIKAKENGSVVLSQSPIQARGLRKRTRAQAEIETNKNSTKSKAQDQQNEPIEESSAIRKNRRTLARPVLMLEDKEKPVKTRGRKKPPPEAEISPSKTAVEAKPLKTRRRGRAVEAQDSPTAHSTATAQGKGKGRKQRTIVEDPEPAVTTRARRNGTKNTGTETSAAQQKASTIKENGPTVKKTIRAVRFRETVEHLSSAGHVERKQVPEKKNAVVVEGEPEAKRKRGNSSKTFSPKESPKKQVAARGGACTTRSTRATRAADQPEVNTQTRGRGRMRVR